MYLVCVLSFCGAFGLFVNLAVCPRKIRVQVRDGSVSFYWERKPFLLNSPKQKNTFLVTTWSFLGRQHTFSACKYNYCFSNIYISLFNRQVPQSTVSFQKMKKVHFLCPNFWTLAYRLGYGMMATSPNVYLIFSHQTLIFGPKQIDCKKNSKKICTKTAISNPK